MAEKLTNNQKRELAELLFTRHDMTQKEIADKVSVSEKTISKWKEAYHWEDKRVSLLTTKGENLRHYYDILDAVRKKIKDSEDGIGDTKLADMSVKYATVIERLETETSAGVYIDVLMEFIQDIQKDNLVLAQSLLPFAEALIAKKFK